MGLYGKTLPAQNGAPIRLVVPWKYGFKEHQRGIVSIRLVEDDAAPPPGTCWHRNEYGFYANVNPGSGSSRWSQASERFIGEGHFRRQAPADPDVQWLWRRGSLPLGDGPAQMVLKRRLPERCFAPSPLVGEGLGMRVGNITGIAMTPRPKNSLMSNGLAPAAVPWSRWALPWFGYAVPAGLLGIRVQGLTQLPRQGAAPAAAHPAGNCRCQTRWRQGQLIAAPPLGLWCAASLIALMGVAGAGSAGLTGV